MNEPVFERSESVAVALAPGVGIGLASSDRRWSLPTIDAAATFRRIHERSAPRWVWWDRATAELLAEARVPIDRCWDVATVHRFMHGGWRTPLGELWARHHGLSLEDLPTMGQLDLLRATDDEGNPDDPVRPDGHLRPEWLDGGFTTSPERLADWAALALQVSIEQDQRLGDLPDPERARSSARSESAADLLCAELSVHGLPVDEPGATALITDLAGPPTHSTADADAVRAERDEPVLAALRPRSEVNLRNPAEVKSMLRRQGFDLPDTRAWRLEQLRESSPLIDALLTWRKAERIATTYGHEWLASHVDGGRLRGEWASSDGAAGRMTASAGLHNLPSMMRPIVRAETGHRLVRADLGQIEPRVLAAVSGDRALIDATVQDDLYRPVAARLGVDRELAKVAVLGAMYGATTGASAGALAGLQRSYPVAMAFLEEAAEAGRRAEDVMTAGGRRVRMWHDPSTEGDLDRAISVAASRGRYARNAVVQGSAAEFFKVWAITVRRRGRPLGAEVVLCLHDELLVHVPAEHADDAATMVAAAVDEAAHYWSPTPGVRFVADVSVVERWSEAKG